jgi:hypothetical protein
MRGPVWLRTPGDPGHRTGANESPNAEAIISSDAKGRPRHPV